MAICVSCGKSTDGYLCDGCRQTADIGKLCRDICDYKQGENELWDKLSDELCYPNDFKNVVFAIADEFPSPVREYWKILSLAGRSVSVAKKSRPWLYETYEVCDGNQGLTVWESNRIKGIVLDALYKDYRYDEAEKIASEIMESDELPKQVYMTLADYYTKTRRYETAGEILSETVKIFKAEEDLAVFRKLTEDNEKQREKAAAGKQEYMPNPKENREEIRQRYVNFLRSIGIEAELPAGRKKAPNPIPIGEYPAPIETREADFDSFVAFDLETTGRNPKIDSIIEIGAVKVVGGRVVDTSEFIFQRFVKPYKNKLSEEVQLLTGISEDDVKNADEMWEVIPKFLEFADGGVLVGFNCLTFDSNFMARAGRYSNAVIKNKYFDVMRYADKFKDKLEIDGRSCSLKTLSEKLDIENPRAHRALADAITTARVYLKLREMDDNKSGMYSESMDDFLSDIDNW